MALNKVLKANSNAELLSYIINVTPELSSEIDLPVQGESIAPIGKLILSNDRYKNAFINTVDLIGLTVIDRNYWENPWEGFANRGTLNFGQSVRELIADIANVYDYNAYANNATHFLATEVPNVYNYIHEVNYQKFYKTTTSDEQMAMAFNTEGGLMDLIEKIVGSLYEGYKYDKYIVDKYMLCRRILDGTVTSVEIDGYASLTARQRVSAIKNISNKMTFRSPNYNPAGVRVATPFADQIMILNTDFEADLSTEVLATSFFMNEAKFKADYTYSLDNRADGSIDGVRATSFFNPETLKNNHWLHTWKVISTSPFKKAVVFTKDVTPVVKAVAVSPSTAVVNPGQSVKLSASVTAAGFANKAVQWSVATSTEGAKATIDLDGNLTIDKNTPASASFTVTATSIYTPTVSGTATVTTPASQS